MRIKNSKTKNIFTTRFCTTRYSKSEIRNPKPEIMTSIIFDLGNVLIDWNPHHLYDKIFPEKEKRDYFLSNICSMEWHSKQDAGRSPKQATEELVNKHKDWEEEIRAFYGRWNEMFTGAIEDSVSILKELKEKGYRLYALTNWNDELFNQALKEYDFLHWFDGRVVSGEEGMNKPEKELYARLLKRFNVDPAEAIFIDDKESNVNAAREIGMDGIVFESPWQLRGEMERRGLL
jgi:2-haloacid dehalogenase